MLTKKKVLHLSLALTKASDIDLLKGDSLLADQGIGDEDKARVREIGQIVQSLCRDYSYELSPSFRAEVASKSPSFCEMKTKMESSQERKKERLENLYSSIRNSLVGSTVLRDLVRDEQLELVERLDKLLADLAMPRE